MKQFLAKTTIILLLSALCAQSGFATKPHKPPADPPTSVSEADADAHSHAHADAAALAGAKSWSDAHARSGDSVATGGDSDAYATTGPVGASSAVEVTGGPVSVDAGDLTVGGDSHSTIIDYDFPVEAPRVLTAYCQDGSGAQTRDFGINITKMNPICLTLQGAQAKFAAGAMLQCDRPDLIAKGETTIRTPSPSECERLQSMLFREGNSLIDEAMVMLQQQQRPGWAKKVWNWIW